MPTALKAKIREGVVFLCVALTVAFVFSTKSYAVEVILVDQPKVRLSIPPGGSQSGVINVENRSSEAKTIRVYLEDWVYLPEVDGSKEFKPAGTTELSCAGWINFFPAAFTLPPFSKRSVHYTVSVPTGVLGGRYAVMFFEDLLSAPGEEGVSVGVAIRIASLFYVEAKGTIKRDARLSNLSLIKKERDVLQISADFKNTGNVDVTTAGTYSIIDEQGMVYARGEFSPVYTLPGDEGRIDSVWKEDIASGEYDLIITLNLGGGVVKVSESRVRIGAKPEVIRFGALE